MPSQRTPSPPSDTGSPPRILLLGTHDIRPLCTLVEVSGDLFQYTSYAWPLIFCNSRVGTICGGQCTLRATVCPNRPLCRAIAFCDTKDQPLFEILATQGLENLPDRLVGPRSIVIGGSMRQDLADVLITNHTMPARMSQIVGSHHPFPKGGSINTAVILNARNAPP